MDHRRNIYNKVSTGISLLTMFLCSWVCFSCSTTKGVPEGDQLFVGLTKIDYQDYERNSNFIDTQVEVEAALATAPNVSMATSVAPFLTTPSLVVTPRKPRSAIR